MNARGRVSAGPLLSRAARRTAARMRDAARHIYNFTSMCFCRYRVISVLHNLTFNFYANSILESQFFIYIGRVQ